MMISKALQGLHSFNVEMSSGKHWSQLATPALGSFLILFQKAAVGNRLDSDSFICGYSNTEPEIWIALQESLCNWINVEPVCLRVVVSPTPNKNLREYRSGIKNIKMENLEIVVLKIIIKFAHTVKNKK